MTDIKEFKITPAITLFNSLQDFINTKIPKDEHSLTYKEIAEKYINPIEHIIEDRIANAVNELSSEQLAEKSINSAGTVAINGYVTSRNFEIDEGLEDIKVDRFKDLEYGGIFISCSLNLRMCTLTYTVSSTFYFDNKKLIDLHYDDIEFEHEETTLKLYVRTYLRISFIMDTRFKDIESLNIDQIEFR